MPVTWGTDAAPMVPPLYRWLMTVATITGIGMSAGYAWRAAKEATRMELALNVTQTVLAREQRLSALGGLAAAAAHELGTPLATISVVAKEMAIEAARRARCATTPNCWCRQAGAAAAILEAALTQDAGSRRRGPFAHDPAAIRQ